MNNATSPFVSPSSRSDQYQNHSYNGTKTPTLPIYSQSEFIPSSVSALSPNAPNHPISPPPTSAYNNNSTN